MNELNHALFKDLIESSFKRGMCVRNPINIIWMLENSENLPQKAQEYLDKLKLKQSDFTHKSSRKVSGITCDVLKDEKIIFKRFDFLLSEIKDLTPYGLSIVDTKSISLLEHSIKSGLDINCESDTYLLKHALENKSHTISNCLYALPGVDKLKIDSEGNNLAHLAALGKNYGIINDLSKEHLSLFYIENKERKTPLDIIFNYKKYDTLPTKSRLSLKECILNFLHLHHSKVQLLSGYTIEVISNSSAFKNIMIEFNHDKLAQSLEYKDESHTPKKINKI